MNMILLPSVGTILNANATGLAVLMLLALGTFTAGVQILSWQICLLGLIMALCVPAAAWIEASALIVSLISIAALAIGVVLWWHWRESRAQKTSAKEADQATLFGEVLKASNCTASVAVVFLQVTLAASAAPARRASSRAIKCASSIRLILMNERHEAKSAPRYGN